MEIGHSGSAGRRIGATAAVNIEFNNVGVWNLSALKSFLEKQYESKRREGSMATWVILRRW